MLAQRVERPPVRKFFELATLVALALQFGCGGGVDEAVGKQTDPLCTEAPPAIPAHDPGSVNALVMGGVRVSDGAYDTAVRIVFPDGGFQSGIVIRPGVILTTAHHTQSYQTVKVYFPDAPNMPVGGTVVAHPGAVRDGATAANSATDFLLAFLEPSTSNARFVLREPEMQVIANWGPGSCCVTRSLSVLGYGGGTTARLGVLPGEVGPQPSDILLLRSPGAEPDQDPNTNTEPGDSGGPYLTYLSNPQDRLNQNVPYGIVAVHRAGDSGQVGYNYGNRITGEVVDWINRAISAELERRIGMGWNNEWLPTSLDSVVTWPLSSVCAPTGGS